MRTGNIFNVVNTLLMCLVIFLVIYPIYYMIIVSISDAGAVMGGKVRFWPIGIHLDVYKQFLTDEYFLKTYKNTAIITLLGTSINMVMTIICAYVLSRKDFYDCFGVELEGVYGDRAAALCRQGLLAQEAGRVFLTEEGISVSNYVMAQFLL